MVFLLGFRLNTVMGSTLNKEINPSLKVQLSEIRGQIESNGNNWAKLEQKALSLTKKYTSPKDKGEIYATIVFIYSDKGAIKKYIQNSKIIKYSQKAIQYPLDIYTKCTIYNRWADVFWVVNPYLNSNQFVIERRKAIKLFLTGLKIALDNGAPKKMPKRPMFIRYDYIGPTNSPEYKKILKKRVEQERVFKKLRLLEKLFLYRQETIQDCISLYTTPPSTTNELKSFAKQILGKYPNTIAEIISGVNKQINQFDYYN